MDHVFGPKSIPQLSVVLLQDFGHEGEKGVEHGEGKAVVPSSGEVAMVFSAQRSRKRSLRVWRLILCGCM